MQVTLTSQELLHALYHLDKLPQVESVLDLEKWAILDTKILKWGLDSQLREITFTLDAPPSK